MLEDFQSGLNGACTIDLDLEEETLSSSHFKVKHPYEMRYYEMKLH